MGARLPGAIMDQIKKDVEAGEYNSVSDWVREACRRFYLDRRGGGVLKTVNCTFFIFRNYRFFK